MVTKASGFMSGLLRARLDTLKYNAAPSRCQLEGVPQHEVAVLTAGHEELGAEKDAQGQAGALPGHPGAPQAAGDVHGEADVPGHRLEGPGITGRRRRLRAVHEETLPHAEVNGLQDQVRAAVGLVQLLHQEGLEVGHGQQHGLRQDEGGELGPVLHDQGSGQRVAQLARCLLSDVPVPPHEQNVHHEVPRSGHFFICFFFFLFYSFVFGGLPPGTINLPHARALIYLKVCNRSGEPGNWPGIKLVQIAWYYKKVNLLSVKKYI
jgi:hypothetical protein